MIENLNIGADAVPEETTSTFTVFMNIDFDEVLTDVKKSVDGSLVDDYASSLFGIDYLGKTLSVKMDYLFSIMISQRSNS
jgi:hypothetical protein